MVKPLIMNLHGNEVFFWNLTSDVGPGCPNRKDDVELVRFGYYCMAHNNKTNQIPAERRALYASVPLQGPFDDHLAQVIRTNQSTRGGTQDGKISAMKNNTGSYGAQFWMIAAMNLHMVEVCGPNWPRIDQHHQTSPELTMSVAKVFRMPPSQA